MQMHYCYIHHYYVEVLQYKKYIFYVKFADLNKIYCIYSFRTINALYDPAVQREIHHEYTGVTEIGESDKNSILGTY